MAMEFNDWVLVGATIAGPVLAVQSQKWIERARATAELKAWIFDTLMATRGARVSPDHVRALNSIDLAFYGWRIFSYPVRFRKSREVLDTWHTYHQHLSTRLENAPKDQVDRWLAAGEELFLNLLQALAAATGHRFDRQMLRTGGYTPVAHERIEVESNIVRRLALEVLAGDRPLKMEIESWPVNQDEVARQRQWQEDLLDGLKSRTDRAAIKTGEVVEVVEEKPAER
jgi:hypothetical protein